MVPPRFGQKIASGDKECVLEMYSFGGCSKNIFLGAPKQVSSASSGRPAGVLAVAGGELGTLGNARDRLEASGGVWERLGAAD